MPCLDLSKNEKIKMRASTYSGEERKSKNARSEASALNA
jgi:hypothetical protein